MTPMEDLDLARHCAERILLQRITPLVGKDFKGQIPKLQSRVAAIRAGQLDGAPEVQSVLLALGLVDRGMRKPSHV